MDKRWQRGPGAVFAPVVSLSLWLLLGVLKAAWSSTLGSRSIVVNGTGSVGRGPVSINARGF